MKNKEKFLIFQPAKSAMQSGLFRINKWCLSNCEMNESYLSSKFCWNGSSNPEKQIKIFFKTLDEAKKFAEKKNISFEIILPGKRKILKKSYSQNFFRKKNA